MDHLEGWHLQCLKILGFSITVTGTDNYTFVIGTTPTVTERAGGMLVTAGPATLTP